MMARICALHLISLQRQPAFYDMPILCRHVIIIIYAANILHFHEFMLTLLGGRYS
jgi:hypothetical protein